MKKEYLQIEEELRGVKSVTVVFPPFKSIIESQNSDTEEVVTYYIAKEDDMPKNKISLRTLVANMYLWKSRNYKMTINK